MLLLRLLERWSVPSQQTYCNEASIVCGSTATIDSEESQWNRQWWACRDLNSLTQGSDLPTDSRPSVLGSCIFQIKICDRISVYFSYIYGQQQSNLIDMRDYSLEKVQEALDNGRNVWVEMFMASAKHWRNYLNH